MKTIKKIFFTVLVPCIYSCTWGDNHISFYINPKDYRISIPVCLQDSITANMIFDTGAVDGAFRLDSTFISAHPSLKPKTPPVREAQLGSAGGVYTSRGLFYDTTEPVSLGNTTINYNQISIYNMRKALGITWSDGIFNMPKNDTTHIWEWNFEHNYLEIHSVNNFKFPTDCYLCSTKTHGFFANYIHLPMQITFDNGDSLTINQLFWVDMGIPNDIAILPSSEEWQFFNKRDSSGIKCKTDNFGRFYTVNAKVFDNLSVDSLRVYLFDESYSLPSKYIVGLNFLKRFNLFFDRKQNVLGFQKIKKFQRLDAGKIRPYYYSTRQTGKYSYIVTKMADFDDNIYRIAGLREGDEITGMNNVEFRVMTNEQYDEFYKHDTTVYNIVRHGQTLNVEVVTNKENY